jgi:hypothetical protein
MSIGSTNPISGSGGSSIFARSILNPGGAIRGWMPQQTQNVDKTYPEFEHIRLILKEAWNTKYLDRLRRTGLKTSITTPFRAVNNAGDLLSRLNYSCGGTCQTPQSRPGLNGLRQRFGAVQATCVPSAIYSSLQMINSIPAAACNVKYVYDSSDYTTYLKQRAVNKNYNDLSYGGDDYNSSQSAIRAIRRY